MASQSRAAVAVSGDDDGRAAGGAKRAGQRFEARAQFGIADGAQAFAQIDGYGFERGRRDPAARQLRSHARTRFDRNARDRRIAEEPVHPLDDGRRDMLEHRSVRTLHRQGQHAVGAAALRETNRFGNRDARITLADDLRPAADHRALNEAEPPERRAPDIGQHVRYRPCRAAACARFGCRLAAGLLRSCLAGFAHRALHAIGAPCPSMPSLKNC